MPMTIITISLRPHQLAALKTVRDQYPHVDEEQLLRLILNVGLKALANDEEAVLCLEAGNALAEGAN